MILFMWALLLLRSFIISFLLRKSTKKMITVTLNKTDIAAVKQTSTCHVSCKILLEGKFRVDLQRLEDEFIEWLALLYLQ